MFTTTSKVHCNFKNDIEQPSIKVAAFKKKDKQQNHKKKNLNVLPMQTTKSRIPKNFQHVTGVFNHSY